MKNRKRDVVSAMWRDVDISSIPAEFRAYYRVPQDEWKGLKSRVAVIQPVVEAANVVEPSAIPVREAPMIPPLLPPTVDSELRQRRVVPDEVIVPIKLKKKVKYSAARHCWSVAMSVLRIPGLLLLFLFNVISILLTRRRFGCWCDVGEAVGGYFRPMIVPDVVPIVDPPPPVPIVQDDQVIPSLKCTCIRDDERPSWRLGTLDTAVNY